MPSTRWLLAAASAVVGLCLATQTHGAYIGGFGAANRQLKKSSNMMFNIADNDKDEDGLLTVLILVVAICGTVVGIGFVVTMVFACVQLFKSVRRCMFGVDEYGVSERMRSQILTDEDSRQSYELALAFERQYPYGSVNTQMTAEQQSQVREKGVEAWELVVNMDVNAMLQSKTEVLFMGGENCVQTNLPLPKTNSVYYFEVKIVEKPTDVNMWIGLATKPYPAWRMTGWNKYSTGYCANNGMVHQNSPFKGVRIGERLFVGDILGIGYQPRSGVVWFTRNGRRFKAIVSGMLYDLFPTISADGPCSFSANFGQRGFVFVEANVKRWGFGPVEGSMLPPPIYGANQNTILLETAVTSSGDDSDDENSSSESQSQGQSQSASAERANSQLEPGQESTVIDIDGAAAAAVSAVLPPAAEPQNIRRGGRRAHGVHKPPLYQKEDPIAMQLLEAGSTSLEPVVSYRNKNPELLESQSPGVVDPSTLTTSSSSSSSSPH
ncbi:Protein ssh4 [Coemansia sp. RSA 1933]|nr:Protein ssh4 [Coemansia sp. RSA 1933]